MIQLAKLSPVDKGFQDVLLDIEIAIDNAAHVLLQLGKIADGFRNTVISVNIVAGRFGAKEKMVADVLLDRSVLVMAPDDGIGQVHFVDHSLDLGGVTPCDLSSEDRSELIGVTDAAVRIQKPLLEGIEGSTAFEDEVVTVFHLGKK